MFYGPSGECGVHGNCPIAILKKESGTWKPLEAGKCSDQECLQWANPTFSQVLKSSHRGMRDLLISSDSGSHYWIKEFYLWNGNHYRRDPKGTTYFLYDSGKDKLVQVAHSRWEKCVREGKGCL